MNASEFVHSAALYAVRIVGSGALGLLILFWSTPYTSEVMAKPNVDWMGPFALTLY